jgi:hypothetical protein
MASLKIARLSEEEDVFAADETKVHTLSQQAISEMLDSAAREESSPPPPPSSGVRANAAPTSLRKSGITPKIPPAAAMPVLWEADDDVDDDEPTRLSDRALPKPESPKPELPKPELPSQNLVAQLINDPPIIICPTPTPEVPVLTADEHAQLVAMTTLHRNFDRKALAITLAAFIATLLPGLVLLHHLLSH